MLILATLLSMCAQDDGIPVQDEPSRQRIEDLESGVDFLHLVPQRPLPDVPLTIGSNHLFHALFGFLPMESAETLEEDRWMVSIREDLSSGSFEHTSPDQFLRYDALLVETTLEVRAGFFGDWEARLAVDVSNLLEENDQDIILAQDGELLVDEGSSGCSASATTGTSGSCSA
jgi:hypothetical protein